MDAAIESDPAARPFPEPWAAGHVPPPRLDLKPLTPGELDQFFRGGEVEADVCEHFLVWASRARGSLDVALAEGLHALRQGDRLASLTAHLDDYAREALDLRKRTAQKLAALGGALRTRPLLREALRSGRVRIRAAETVLPVAVGEAEALWVARASVQTVRQLEDAVRRARSSPEDEEEQWQTLRSCLSPEEREVVDDAMKAAGRVLRGSGRVERMEAIAQEFLGGFPSEDDPDETRPLGPAFRTRLPRPDARARLEAETERWAALEPVGEWPAPDVRFDDRATAEEIDERLRKLGRLRAEWDALIGYWAHVVRSSGIHLRMGFMSFRHYADERLGLPARALEQRTELERRLWQSEALREARRQGLSYEKLRVLARLPEADIASWISRAQALTCIALKRAVEGERERQMRAQRRVAIPLPERVARLVDAAIRLVQARLGHLLSAGACLAVMAFHFLETWAGMKPPRSRSQKIRDRDQGFCKVPGCSHRATHAHHVRFRSRGGGDEEENQVGLCAFHHLRCIHGGSLTVFGRAPDGLTWMRKGVPWTGT